MKYIIRTPDGKEYGPVDQEVLTQWAESGRVTPDCEVRNIMLKTWSEPNKLPFLDEAFRRGQGKPKPAEVPDADEEDAVGPREAVYSLLQTGIFKFNPANPLQRLLAWLFDMIIVGGVGLALFLVVHVWLNVVPRSVAVEAKPAWFLLGTLLMVLFTVFYYVVGFGFKAQTVGQWFWGIMVLRTKGEPILLFRALLYFMLSVIFLPTTVLCAILPGRRGLQEFIAGVRVVKTTIRDRK